MKKVLKRIVRILIGLIIFCLLAIPFLFTTIDRTPYQEMPYYKVMSAQLDTFRLDTSTVSFLKVGWSKQNITPSYMPDLAGYGLRDKASCIHDSVFARAFVFDNGKTKAVFLTVDLLIFPPVVEARLREQVKSLGYDSSQLYLSATHTHSAPGGWAEGPAGRVLAGSYKEEYVQQLVSSLTECIKTAEKNLEEADLGFEKVEAKNFVRNRLNMPDSKVDPWVRILKVQKKTGAKAAIVVYAAHANCFKMEYSCISGDYPAQLISQMERQGKVDFVMYAAGMVGSHTPKPIFESGKELENEPLIEAYGDSIANRINKRIDSLRLEHGSSLATAQLELPLREPHLKISQNWRVRPWVFKALFGSYHPKIKIMKINNVVFLGMPCDFSGELMTDFERICQEKNLQLVITSFNGGYVGYINVDRYYDKNKAETRDMNWFGPYNQAYFTEIVQRILKRI